MRVEGLLLALLWVLGGLCHSDSLSTCRPLDLELVKRKRIEAIRGQILSKLRLPKEPEDDDDDDGEEIPPDLLSVYNSTLELSEEQTQHTIVPPTEDVEDEAYFAKEVHKFNMLHGDDKSKYMMLFNITDMRTTLGTERLFSQAELRLLIKNPQMELGEEQRLELYRGTGDKARYLGSWFVSNEPSNRWLSFDVTPTVRDWLQQPEKKQGFQVKLHCPCGESKKDFKFEVSGMGKDRGDKAILSMRMRPHILVMSLPVERHSSLNSRRKRQTTAEESCSEKSENCCVRKLYIDFRKDLGWKWIHEPTGYYANYCIGSCSYVWNTENKYSQVLALYKHHNPGASAQPCCVPQVLDPLPILYYVGRQHKVEHLSNMIVRTCKCS